MFDYTLSYLQLNQITWKLDFRGRRELTCPYRLTGYRSFRCFQEFNAARISKDLQKWKI